MFQQLSAKQQRYLAIELLALLVLLILWLFIVPLWINTSEKIEQVEELRFRLTKYQQAIQNGPALTIEKNNLDGELREADLYYSGMAPGVAAATIQTTIREMVNTVEGNLISTRILAEKKSENFTKISISVALNSGDAVLQELLYQLEASRPLLLVEKVVINSTRRPNIIKPQTTPLRITLEIAGFLVRKKGS